MGSIAEDMARLRAEIEMEKAARHAAAMERRAAVADLAHEVREQLVAGHHERLERADALRGKLQETIQEIVVEVDQIKREAREQIVTHGHERVRGALADAHERAQALASVREEVASICSESAMARAEVRAELAYGRAAWQAGTAPPARAAAPAKPRSSKPAAAQRSAAPAPTPAAAKPAPAPAAPRVDPNRVDDLEEIVGIGPSTKRVLAEAGIRSFGAIAASSPEKLNEVLGDLARFANVEHWIRQAQDRLG